MFLIRVADTKIPKYTSHNTIQSHVYFLLPVWCSRPLAVQEWNPAGGSGLPLQPAADWLSWWWTGTDGPAASEPAGCDTWWDSPGESAPEGQE